MGLSLQCALLEMSRVYDTNVNERTFHIFYALLGAPDSLLKNIGLQYQDDRSPYPITPYNFEEVDTALGNIGFTTEQRLSIYKILAGIIFLRKIKFDAIDESAHIVDSRESLINASELIGIDFNALEKALIMRCICVNQTTIE